MLALHATLCALATPARAVVVDPDQRDLTLGPHLLIIPDPDGNLDAAAVARGEHDGQARVEPRPIPNLGYLRHPYWVRVALENGSDRPLQRLLVLRRGSKHVQDIRVDGPLGTRELRIGRGGSVSGDVVSRHATVRLLLPAQSTTQVTVRFDSRTGAALDYRLTTEAALAEKDAFDLWIYGMLLGICVAIAFYVLSLFVVTRSRIYLLFAGLTLFGVTYQLHFEGFAFVGLWGRQQLLGNYATIYGGVLQVLCFIGFIRDAIDAPHTLPREDWWLFKLPFALLLLVYPLYPLLPWLGNLLSGLGSIVAVMGLAVGIVMARLRHGAKGLALGVAFVLYWFAASLFLLKQAALLPDLPAFNALFPLTFAAAVMIFAVAVARRFRDIGEQKRLALERAAERLESMVQERTAELKVAKERAETALEHLQQAQHELVTAEKMASLGQLVAGVAHEINTPIGVAITAASYLGERGGVLRQRLESGELKRSDLLAYLEDNDRSAALVGDNLARAARLVRTFKQVSADRSSDDRRQFELRQYLLDLIESLRPGWKHRPIGFALDCPGDIVLDGYPGTLGQVVTNLVQNALLHAFDDERAGHMRLSARMLDADQVELCFEDDGKGIDAEGLRLLFEPFYTTKRGQGGTGLGLHIVFNLVAGRLGGRVEADGAPDQGMRFVMRLPRIAPTG